MLSAYASSAEGELDEIQDDTKTSEKATALHSALSQLEGDFCKESRLSLQRFFGARRTPVIPTLDVFAFQICASFFFLFEV